MWRVGRTERNLARIRMQDDMPYVRTCILPLRMCTMVQDTWTTQCDAAFCSFCYPLAIPSYHDEQSSGSPFAFVGSPFSSGCVARLTRRLADRSSAPSPCQPSADDNRMPQRPSLAAPCPPLCARHGGMHPHPAWACAVRRRVRVTHLRGLPLCLSIR